MKNLKTFENFDQESENMPGTLKALLNMWTFDPEAIKKVFYHFSSNGRHIDDANEYLELMDGLEVTNPAEAWDDYCMDNDLEHEIDNNPFI